MNDSTDIHPTTESENRVEAGGQAEGINFALESIARSREAAKGAKDRLNATRDINEHAIFLPDTHGVHVQARAHAAILSYHSEIVKRPYIDKINAHDFVKEPYATVGVPAITREEGKTVIETEQEGDLDIDLEPVQLTLETLPWWSMQFITIKRRQPDSWGDPTVETEQKKVVLPPKAIDKTYARLDELASRLNILLQVQEMTPHGST